MLSLLVDVFRWSKNVFIKYVVWPSCSPWSGVGSDFAMFKLYKPGLLIRDVP